MTDPLQTASDAAHAAIARLADAGHRAANEHAYAVDRLRAECEALRTQNKGLRERVADLEHRVNHNVKPVGTEAQPVRKVVRGIWDSVWPMVGTRDGRLGIGWGDGTWSLYEHEDSDRMGVAHTEAQAIAWVLDGVLP